MRTFLSAVFVMCSLAASNGSLQARSDAGPCGTARPLGTASSGRLSPDVRAGRLPAFSFVTPNLCDDMHDCRTATGDRWLSRWLPRIVAGPDYRAGATVLVITFDESEQSSNRVATVVVSPSTPPGTRSALRFSHYSLLETTEQLLGLPTLGRAAAPTTRSMRAAFHL